MLFFLASFHHNEHKAWDPNPVLCNEISNQNQRIQLFTPQNFWIHSCYFQNIYEYWFSGGAISLTTESNQTILFVERTTFFNCSCRGPGGSIYQEHGNIKLKSICCSLPDIGSNFVSSFSTNTYDHFQYLEYCSCISSGTHNKYVDDPLIVEYGCISIRNFNISQIYNTDDFLSLVHLMPHDFYYNDIQYSSFVNNSCYIRPDNSIFFLYQVIK